MHRILSLTGCAAAALTMLLADSVSATPTQVHPSIAVTAHSDDLIGAPQTKMKTVSRRGPVGQGTYAVSYPVSQDKTIARYLAKILRDCGPHMADADQQEAGTECNIQADGLVAQDRIVSMQVAHSDFDGMRFQHWWEAQIFRPTATGYKALKPSEIVDDNPTCKILVGKALLKESTNPVETSAPVFTNMSPVDIFGSMWVASVNLNSIEFWQNAGSSGIPNILTLQNSDMGDCLVVRK